MVLKHLTISMFLKDKKYKPKKFIKLIYLSGFLNQTSLY